LDHLAADPSIPFAPGSPVCHQFGKALLSPGLSILLPGKVEPHGESPCLHAEVRFGTQAWHLTNARVGRHPPLSSGHPGQKLAHSSSRKKRAAFCCRGKSYFGMILKRPGIRIRLFSLTLVVASLQPANFPFRWLCRKAIRWVDCHVEVRDLPLNKS
jgi:hypothetical protein